MNKILILTVLLIFNKGTSQKPIDSIYFESRMDEIESYQEQIEIERDSLQRELLFYRVKEDYYSAALNEQATRFGVIIGSILGLLALFSFGWYRMEKRRINQQLNGFKTNFNNLKREIEEKEKKNAIFLAGSLTFFGEMMEEKNRNYLAFMIYLRSSLELLGSEEKDMESHAIDRLNLSLTCLQKVKGVKDQEEELKEHEEEVFTTLNSLETIGNKEVKKVCAEIRVMTHTIFEEEKVSATPKL